MLEKAGAQTPLVTFARKYVVAIKGPVFKVAAVAPEISVNVTLSGEDCHWMVPVLPAKVIVEEEPLQIAAGKAVAVPPTEVGFTVTVAALEKSGGQTPLVTFARKN